MTYMTVPAWPTAPESPPEPDSEGVPFAQRELARMALQLLADAEFDPWQAPEAWRLLAPKNTPRDISPLKYTREGKYQLGVLKVEYKNREQGIGNRE